MAFTFNFPQAYPFIPIDFQVSGLHESSSNKLAPAYPVADTISLKIRGGLAVCDIVELMNRRPEAKFQRLRERVMQKRGRLLDMLALVIEPKSY